MHKFLQVLASAYKFGELPFLTILNLSLRCAAVYSCMYGTIFNFKSLKISQPYYKKPFSLFLDKCLFTKKLNRLF